MNSTADEQPAVLVHSQCQLGENPLWHSEHRSLYWCDITVGKLFRYHLSTRRTEVLADGRGKPDRMIGRLYD